MKTGVLTFLTCMSLVAASDPAQHWVGTWASAPYEAGTNTPPVALTNNTLRQIVRVSIGGDTLRVKFSNSTFSKAITLNAVTIAVSPDGTKSPVTASTITPLKFDGKASVTINAKAEVYSDPVAFALKPSMRLAITTYYGQCETSSTMTHHYGSRTDSYIATGDKTTAAELPGATVVERWYTICGIDVVAPQTAASVAVIGNSITDGYGLHGGLQNRWTDAFSEKLLKTPGTEQVGVLNLGIGATNVLSAANGAKSGVDRFGQDCLNQAGVRWVIIFYGINDINGGASATSLINGFKTMATAAHAKNLKVYGATITPVNGNSYYSAAHEGVRSQVNAWIRTDKTFDAFFDFDKAVRNPTDTTRLQQTYSNDWLHPSAAGQKALGESIDPRYFEIPVAAKDALVNNRLPHGGISIMSKGGRYQISFTLAGSSFVSLTAYSTLGRKITEIAGKHFTGGSHSILYTPESDTPGMYIFMLKADGVSAIASRAVPAVW
jgi:lysophospholipase L1-like esterase